MIPETLEEATSAAWLSEVLGAKVASVAVGEVDNRVSTNAPVHVELVDGGGRDIWVKGYFSEIGRAVRSAGVPEALFYKDLVGTTGMRTLRPVFAEADEATDANVIVTEDVVGEGAVFLDSLSDYSVDQAAESLDQLAMLHAATWSQPRWADARWLDSRLDVYTQRRGVAEIDDNFQGPIGADVPDAARDAQRLYDAYVAVAAEVATASPWCVIHGDVHPGNLFLDAAGRPSFVDWQLVQRGPWYLDVGYHISSVLTVADRRANEERLVRHYLERLGARGVTIEYGDAVWDGLRRGMIHGFYLWGITQKVDPRKTTALLERLGTAVADHDAFAAVGV